MPDPTALPGDETQWDLTYMFTTKYMLILQEAIVGLQLFGTAFCALRFISPRFIAMAQAESAKDWKSASSVYDFTEPGGSEEIQCFALKSNVKFDLFQKVDVNGDNASPLWKYLKMKQGGTLGDFIKWNFTKFIIDKNGQPVERHGPKTDPKPLNSTFSDFEGSLIALQVDTLSWPQVGLLKTMFLILFKMWIHGVLPFEVELPLSQLVKESRDQKGMIMLKRICRSVCLSMTSIAVLISYVMNQEHKERRINITFRVDRESIYCKQRVK
ncbi:Glutathione peroxidase [Gryllus bimaculatus]|nr:Glutathione peroxidase [Gryllus bimaculatus]